ncbi:disulfide bond formation protein B [Aureimonas altamirensis]|uniref:disulfide bond formation protein B n=1 Tax=Aureimonas altamirensis TaxID=370622 RepID=UPI0020369D37|nr:disulfide bond formation protein B [Aureimonas altamirensis]MCM2505606.1 disulfide bond formation protein B [Aureimonas altamirensis]
MAQSQAGQGVAAVGLTLAMGAVVGGALLFQHVGGYMPCALCLEQRTPYYIGIGVGIAAIAAVSVRLPQAVVRGLFALIGLMMLWTLVLGAYHAGVEWGFWAGPADCAAGGAVDLTGDLLSSMDAIRPPSCSEAALRVLGLSMAGWNVLAAAALAFAAFRTAMRRG